MFYLCTVDCIVLFIYFLVFVHILYVQLFYIFSFHFKVFVITFTFFII